ncbi:MAG TPA: glycosyltransferase [Labilithrix sp.]|nr:glycosyltransferase [Labilithrix sp.]
MRLAYPRADAVVAVSAGAADDLAASLGTARDRIVSIPNPAVTPGTRQREAEPVAHPWLAETPGVRAVPVVLAAGRLVVKKGFALLLDAFARARRERELRLVILGEGPMRRALESRIATLGLGGVVALPGFVENPLAWFARADLFVLSSFAAGMPNALLQAMAAGCPVVATDCPSGPREILEDGRWGTLVPPGNAGALADAIVEALGARQLRSESRARAEAFGIEPIAARYAQLLFGEGATDVRT